MPDRIWSSRLAGPVVVNSTTGVALFTVPTSHKYVVRWLAVVNTSSTVSSNFRVGFTSGVAMASRVFFRVMQPGENFYSQLMIPVSAGETLYAASEVTPGCVITVAGYDFLEGA